MPFDCKMCGHCCHGEGGIILTNRDLDRLAEHLLATAGLKKDRFVAEKTVERHGTRRLDTDAQGWCVFYNPDLKGCAVHPARPDVCRAWPFFRGNLVDESSWRMIQDDYCPGVNGQAGFAAFVKYGREYLRANGLVHQEKGAPNALQTDNDNSD